MPKNSSSKIKIIITGVAFLLAIFSLPAVSQSHPGRRDKDGCHYCRTNCDKYGVSWNSRHCHNGSSAPSSNNVAPTPTAPSSKIETKTEKTTEIIKFEAKEQNNLNLEKGEKKLSIEGKSGKKEITYKVTYTDGKETNREKISEKIITKPIIEVYAIGTKEPAPTASQTSEVAGEKTEKTSWGSIIGYIIGFTIIGGIIYIIFKRRKK